VRLGASADAATLKTCLRCDWEGDTKDVGCPNCGVPLYLAGASPSVTVEAPAGSDPEERSRDATSTERVGLSATRSPGLDPPTSPRDALGSPGRSIRSAGPFVLAALVLTVVLGTWLRSHEEGARSASTDAAVNETPISDGSSTPAVTPTPTPARFGSSELLRVGRHSLVVAGVPFSFSVPTSGWERFGKLYISKSTVRPQGAQAIIFWTDMGGGVNAESCGQWWGSPVGSVADFATNASRMRGTELVKGPSDVTVGRRAAKYVVLKVREDVGCDPGLLYTRPDVAGGAFWTSTDVGDTMRIWLVKVGRTVLFIGGATHKQADSDLEQEIQRIVGSIRFG
jgi:hypothetical protein